MNINSIKSKKNIICLATRRIDDPLPTNVQHLMLRLAKNNRILYVEPPVDSVFLSQNQKFDLRNKHLKLILPESLNPIWPKIFPYERWLPFFLPFLNRKKIIASIRRSMKKYKIKPEILWLFRPQDYWMVEHLNPAYLCYHITDKYNTMPSNIKSKKDAILLDKVEKKILRHANLVFCTARSLWKEVSFKGEKAIYVGNVADVKHFDKANNGTTKIPDDIVDLPQPIVGFFGSINNFKIDYNLIKITARTFSKGSVVLIGPMRNLGQRDEIKLPRESNIHYLGIRNYYSLPSYLKAFNICIIPYIDSEYTRHVFPLKFFEYLSAGKPVVATSLASLENFRDLFYQASNESEWIAALKMAISENSKDKQSHRKKIALMNSWHIRAAEIENYLCEL